MNEASLKKAGVPGDVGINR